VNDLGVARPRGKTRAPTAKNAVVPQEPSLPSEERRERELAKPGIGRCALCPWAFEGAMKDVLAAQLAHRESHGVRSHPEVRKQSANVKRNRARFKARVESLRAKGRESAKSKAGLAPDGRCLECGDYHRSGKGHMSHERFVKQRAAAAEASRRRWAQATEDDRRKHGEKIRRAQNRPIEAPATPA
jgi:hypothetical protein